MEEKKTLFQILQDTGLPCAYSHFTEPQSLPYIVYIGSGQDTFQADNTHYYKRNTYQIEYYFKNKNEDNEASIENALLEAGYLYDKSEDIYIESENVFMIYYYI